MSLPGAASAETLREFGLVPSEGLWNFIPVRDLAVALAAHDLQGPAWLYSKDLIPRVSQCVQHAAVPPLAIQSSVVVVVVSRRRRRRGVPVCLSA